MDVYTAIFQRRSIRRFQQKPVSLDLLKKLVNAGRLAPSAANLQPLEYLIVTEPKRCAHVFETVGWAGYIKPQWTPAEYERPTAYIILLVRKDTAFDAARDVGLAAENIMLAAEAENLGSCILMKVNREQLRAFFKIPETFTIDSVIALGYKAEQPVVEDLKESVEYWRDENDILHVPKRKLEAIIHVDKF